MPRTRAITADHERASADRVVAARHRQIEANPLCDL